MNLYDKIHTRNFSTDISIRTRQIIWYINEHGKIVHGFDAWHTCTGQTIEQTKNSGWITAILPEDQQRLTDLITHVTKNPQPFEIVIQVKHADAMYRSMLLRGAPEYTENGCAWMGSLIDITSLGSSTSYMSNPQPAITQTSMLENLLDSTDIGYVQYDLKGNIVYINQGGRQMFGFDLDQSYLTLNIDERGKILHARNLEGIALPKHQLPWTRILNGETLKRSQAVEVIIRTLYGRDIITQMHGIPLRDENNVIQGAILLIRDVSYRRHADLRMQKGMASILQIIATLTFSSPATEKPGILQDAIFHLLEALHDALDKAAIALGAGIDDITPLGIIGMTNQTEMRWQDNMLHNSLHNYLQPHDLEQVLQGKTLLVKLAPGESISFTLIGHPYMLIAPIPGHQSPCIGVIGIKHSDSTHHYTDDELALIKAAANIAGALIERDQLIHEREKAIASTMAAKETTKRMNQFIRITGHEFKTPLSHIKVSGQFMKHWVNNGLQSLPLPITHSTMLQKMSELFDSIDLQVNRMNRMADDLLDVARLQIDSLSLQRQQHDLFKLIINITEQYQLIYPNRTILLVLPKEEVCNISIDRDRIMQVISNYISNAIKYSRPDQPILITAEYDPYISHLVTVAVVDEGMGIIPEIVPFIWDLYFQGQEHEIQDGSQVGLGLGLFLAKAIIAMHGGTVRVESTPGAGSIFLFALPIEMVGE